MPIEMELKMASVTHSQSTSRDAGSSPFPLLQELALGWTPSSGPVRFLRYSALSLKLTLNLLSTSTVPPKKDNGKTVLSSMQSRRKQNDHKSPSLMFTSINPQRFHEISCQMLRYQRSLDPSVLPIVSNSTRC